ncbi:SpoIIE family protein phosphatase [Streptomyces sp. NPDC048018]|uniref:SpoIIE family protein phosphatase n=1 Tax=Streptomyces sp. NPDC048018 TaxID=3365499 RepID=UPI003717306D
MSGGDDLPGLGEAVLDALFTQSDVGVHVLDPQLRVLRVNPVAIGMRGVEQESLVGRPVAEAYAALGVHVDEAMFHGVLATGRPVHEALLRSRPLADPDREHVFSVSVYRLRNEAGRTLGLVATAVDVTERERAQGRLDLLHRARERIGGSLDVERTARELVDVMVPDFADGAVVALTDSVLRDGAPRPPSRDSPLLLRCAAAGGAAGERPPPPVGSVLLPGLFGADFPSSPVVLTVPGSADEDGTPEGQLLVASLSARDQVLGAVAFRRRPGAEPFTDEDVELVRGVTSRTAISLENALRFTREHIVMTALQSWPLRQEQDTRRAAEIAQRHRPGGRGGASWFDALPLPGARVAFVVGKVEDPVLSAVATMSRLRTAVHSLTTLDLDPHELLARLHSTVLRLAREQAATGEADEPTAHCTFAVHDPVTGRLDVARAGRSLLAIVHPDGSLDTSPLPDGPLLGREGPPFASTSLVLPEGSTICLASPADTEQSGPALEDLANALGHPVREPEQLADDVGALLAADRVLLVARTRRLPDGDVAEWTVESDFRAVGPARRKAEGRLREWKSTVDPFAAALVVSELVTNAVRYGAGPITLRLIRGGTTLLCEVDDAALTAPYLHHAKAVDEGGRGLYICATLAESWGVRYREHGKTVWAELSTTPDAEPEARREERGKATGNGSGRPERPSPRPDTAADPAH